MTFNVTASPTNRLGGLRRFAIAITVFNILGHTVFGFEQAWIQPLASVLTAYACEIWFELVDCLVHSRKPRFAGGWRNAVDDRKSTRLNSSHLGISYAVFCLKK